MFQGKILYRAALRRSRPSGGKQWVAPASAVLGLLGATAAMDQSSDRKICHCQGHATMSSTPSASIVHKNEPATSNHFCLEDAYDIEHVLGHGAYGMVYQARRKTDGTIVALKSMSRSLTGKTDFEREVAALQLLNANPHSHIVQLYDLHRDENNYYLSMELIQGGELLEHLIDHGPYSEALAASFLRQFAEAITHVHSHGLAHADLKPENLLLSSNDTHTATLKLADFGCARTHDQSRQDMRLPAQEFADGCSFLHMVALGNQFELEKRLQERPHLVNFRDYDFRTPLHLAASEGHVDICRFLVERGTRVNRSDRWGGSPLDDAHRHRHAEVIQYLRQHGATFGSKTQLPRFIQAASEGDQEEVQALLEFGNIDLDQGDYDRRTALHLAAGEGRLLEIVELLCQAGANVNVEDRWGNRPLDDAASAKKNSTRIVRLLVQTGASSIQAPSLHRQIATQEVDTNAPKQLRSKPSQKKKKNKEKESTSGTIAYWPPEMFVDGAIPTPASDMWAAGVIMYVLLTGSHPFDKNVDQTDEQIQEAVVSVGCDKEGHMERMNQLVFDERVEGLSDSCVELMRQLLQSDPKKRMTSDAFLRHPWIQGLTASWTTMGKTHNELKAFWQHKFKAEILKKFAGTDNLSEESVMEIFKAMDLKKNGVLELEEVRTTFRDLGISDKNIQTMFSSADLDGTGVVHFDEFRALLLQNKDSGKEGPLHVGYLRQRFKSRILGRFLGNNEQSTPLDKDKLREIFNTINLEGNGVLDPHDIRVVLRSAGEPEDVISRIVASLDIRRNGRVSWDDFLLIMGANDN